MDLEIEKIRNKYRESEGSGGFVNPTNMNHYTDWLEQQLKNCNLQNVIQWVAITEPNHPQQLTEVLVKFKDGGVKCRYFDGDMRFYNIEQDIDITEMITHWAALPE